MEVFINELSLQEQYNTIEEFSQSVLIFTKIVSTLNGSNCKYAFFKKGDFFGSKKAVLRTNFSSSVEKIRDRDVRTFFKDVVYNKANPKNWLDEQVHSNDDNYYCETLKSNITGQTLAEISERKIRDTHKKFLLLNFNKSSFANLSHTVVTKNKNDKIDISCVDTIENTEKWIVDNCIVIPIIENTKRFERTSKQVKGATIYKEKETSYYWYLDTLHRNHYEVFNAQKEHLGEADLEGNIDTSKKDSSKNGRIDI